MVLPLSPVKYFEKNLLDREIDHFASLDIPTFSDLNRIGTAAQVQCGIDEQRLARFRCKGLKMDEDALKNERHCSNRMARQLTCAGFNRPSQRCDAHAIVSGNHKFAAQMRAVLAWCKLRVDDHHNGCWLPRSREDRPHMPSSLQKAVPHKNIHTHAYYEWLEGYINPISITSLNELVEALRRIRFRLQSGSIPQHIFA